MAKSDIEREVGKAAFRMVGRHCNCCHRNRTPDQWTNTRINKCDECVIKYRKPVTR